VALINGLFVSVMPSLLFGCEVWGISAIYNIMFHSKSPYSVEFLSPIHHFLRRVVGLPPNSSVAILHRFFALPSFLRLVLPRMVKLFDLM
jgi:hypothetical protein